MSFIPPPLPSYATQMINPFLIQGSQPIMIKWADFQPVQWWNSYKRGLSLYRRISFLLTFPSPFFHYMPVILTRIFFPRHTHTHSISYFYTNKKLDGILCLYYKKGHEVLCGFKLVFIVMALLSLFSWIFLAGLF